MANQGEHHAVGTDPRAEPGRVCRERQRLETISDHVTVDQGLAEGWVGSRRR